MRMMRIALLTMLAMSAAACSAPRVDNTRLASSDLVVMTDQMAASLAKALPEPPSAGPGWIVTLDRVVNRTNDIIPDGEKWAFMARLRAQLAQTPDLKSRGVQFILPAAQRAQLNERQSNSPADLHPPTHALTATFYALTTAGRQSRTDTYLCAFQLLELGTDRILWEDKYEIKKAVLRNSYD